MSRILIIDDDEMVTRVLQEGLTQAGFAVEATSEAFQGYKAAAARRPDLVLMDVQLPEMSGIDLIQFFKNDAQLKSIPIIMLTGSHHQTEHKVKAMERGADDYILKPFVMEELVARIHMVIRRLAPQTSVPAATTTTVPVKSAGAPFIAALPAQNKVANPPVPFVHVGHLMENVLCNPTTIVKGIQYPRLAPTYVISAVAFIFLGVAMTASSPIRPLAAGLWVTCTWGMAVATLVMCCSIMGLHLKWKEGAYIISLAGIPALLKIIGGTVVSILISLSPFLFTLSPALMTRKVPWVLGRLDVFELWSAALLWIFLRQWSGGNKKRASIGVGMVWLICASLAAVLLKLLEPGGL